MIGLGCKGNMWELWWVTVVFICYLYCVNVMLRIRYCNIWWSVHGWYDKYTVWRPITNTHENMTNIMSTGSGSAWWRIWRVNGGRWYLKWVGCIDWWRNVVLTVRRVWCGDICGWGYRIRGGIDKIDGFWVWVEMWEKMFVFMSAFG